MDDEIRPDEGARDGTASSLLPASPASQTAFNEGTQGKMPTNAAANGSGVPHTVSIEGRDSVAAHEAQQQSHLTREEQREARRRRTAEAEHEVAREAPSLPPIHRSSKSLLTAFCRREVVALVRRRLVAERGGTLRRLGDLVPIGAPIPLISGPEFEQSFVNVLPNGILIPKLLSQIEEYVAEKRKEMGQATPAVGGGGASSSSQRVADPEAVAASTEQRDESTAKDPAEALIHHKHLTSITGARRFPPHAVLNTSMPEFHFFDDFQYTDELVRFGAGLLAPLEMEVVERKTYEHFLKELEVSVAIEEVCTFADVQSFIIDGLHLRQYPLVLSRNRIEQTNERHRVRCEKLGIPYVKPYEVPEDKDAPLPTIPILDPVTTPVDRASAIRILKGYLTVEQRTDTGRQTDAPPPDNDATEGGNRKGSNAGKEVAPVARGGKKEAAKANSAGSDNENEDGEPTANKQKRRRKRAKSATACDGDGEGERLKEELPQQIPSTKPTHPVQPPGAKVAAGRKSKKPAPPPYEIAVAPPPPVPAAYVADPASSWSPDMVRRLMGGLVLPKGTDLNLAPPYLLDYCYQQRHTLSPSAPPFRPASSLDGLGGDGMGHRTPTATEDDDIRLEELIPPLSNDDDDDEVGSTQSSLPFVSHTSFVTDTPLLSHKRNPVQDDGDHVTDEDDVNVDLDSDEGTPRTPTSSSSSSSSSSLFSSVVGSQRAASSDRGTTSRWSSATTSPFHQALDWRAAAVPLPPPTDPLPLSCTGVSRRKVRRGGRRAGKRRANAAAAKACQDTPSIPRPMRPADLELPASTPPGTPLCPPSRPPPDAIPSTPTTLTLYRASAFPGSRRRHMSVREALIRVLASASSGGGSSSRRPVPGRLAITAGPSHASSSDSSASDEKRGCRQGASLLLRRRRLRKALQRCGRSMNAQPRNVGPLSMWRLSPLMPRVSHFPHRRHHQGNNAVSSPPPLDTTTMEGPRTTGEGAQLSVLDVAMTQRQRDDNDTSDVVRDQALLRKATLWGRDHVNSVSAMLGIEPHSNDKLSLQWSLALPNASDAMLESDDPMLDPTAQVRHLSSVLHTALQHSSFMEGSTLAMRMSSETTPDTPQPYPPSGHPSNIATQAYTTRSVVSVEVSTETSRLPIVSIPSAMLRRLQGGVCPSSAAAPQPSSSSAWDASPQIGSRGTEDEVTELPLNILVALQAEGEPDDDGASSSTSSFRQTLPTNEQVVEALSSMVVELNSDSPTPSTDSPLKSPNSNSSKRSASPRDASSRRHGRGYYRHHQRRTFTTCQGERENEGEFSPTTPVHWGSPAGTGGGIGTTADARCRQRLLSNTSSLSSASRGRNNAVFFANSPIFRALEGFLNSAITQLPYVAVFHHRDGVVSSAEPQLISTEEQPLLLLFLLLGGGPAGSLMGGERGSSNDEGRLKLPPSLGFGQRLLQ